MIDSVEGEAPGPGKVFNDPLGSFFLTPFLSKVGHLIWKECPILKKPHNFYRLIDLGL